MSRDASPMTPTARRTRYGVRTLILLAAVTVSCIVAPMLAARHARRFDVTATRDNALSPRTLAVLGSLDGPREVIISADLSRLDRRARARIGDLLDEFARAAPRLSANWIDTSSEDGRRAFGAMLGRFADRERDLIAAHASVLTSAAEAAEALPADLSALSDALKSLAESLDAFDQRRAQTEQNAAVLRTIASQLAPAAEAARRAATNTLAGVALPDGPGALERLLPPLQDVARACEALASATRAPDPSKPQPTDDANRAIAELAPRVRDRAATAADAVARLKPLQTLTVARLLQSQDAVLVASPTALTAIQFDALFPTGPAGGAGVRFAGEELITAALASLSGESSPIVVLVHADAAPLLSPSGAPTPIARRSFARLLDRLALRRIEIAEWPVAARDAPPDRATLDATRSRPIVWVIFPAPSRAAIDPRDSAAVAARTQRIGKLAAAVQKLVNSGESVLLSVDPSDLPAVGEPDPIAAAVLPLGVRLDSARPLVRLESSPSGPVTWTLHSTTTIESADHPIAKACAGLTVALPWATTLEAASAEPGVSFAPLLSIAASESTWGESQWFGFRYANLRQPLSPLLLADPPQRDPARDATAGPWVIAGAVERANPTDAAARPQRALIVASPSWFDDFFTQAADTVDARPVRLFPGNAELFESGVYWLAGLDQLIATSPQAREISRIPSMNSRQISILRWALIAGVPLGVLIFGGIARLARR